jgi:hypothetical protein
LLLARRETHGFVGFSEHCERRMAGAVSCRLVPSASAQTKQSRNSECRGPLGASSQRELPVVLLVRGELSLPSLQTRLLPTWARGLVGHALARDVAQETEVRTTAREQEFHELGGACREFGDLNARVLSSSVQWQGGYSRPLKEIAVFLNHGLGGSFVQEMESFRRFAGELAWRAGETPNVSHGMGGIAVYDSGLMPISVRINGRV